MEMDTARLTSAMNQWLAFADAQWLRAHTKGELLCPVGPGHPWSQEREWEVTGWTALRRAFFEEGIRPERPLPEALTRHRDEEGRTVIAMLFRLRDKSTHPEIWVAPLEKALSWGCNPWVPGMDGDSGILKLLNETNPEAMEALVNALDRQGVDWSRTFHPDQPDHLVTGTGFPWPVEPEDTLLEQAAFNCTSEYHQASMIWLIRFLGDRLRPNLDRRDKRDRLLEDQLLEHNPARETLALVRGRLLSRERQEKADMMEKPEASRRPRRRT
jgi:hypothetical protein